MRDYQAEFIDFAIRNEVLQFGRFTLKSGRISPYFFNSGLFNDGSSLRQLGTFYMQAIEHAGLQFDMLFGPAYKGIPLVAAVAIAYSGERGRSLPYCFNRKEEKDHGEGGTVAGAPLHGSVLIIDDVITAGTSVHLSMDLIRRNGARAAAVVIALDRQERGRDDAEISAIDEIAQRYGIPVVPIITLDDLVEFLRDDPAYSAPLEDILNYRKEQGIRRRRNNQTGVPRS
ncbi:MAG: orotate phosphoribosyltransferase [Gammaproteobacteria bacterium]|nr:orotate phosphoribosyltransferase [Gammaproteobacteria bacterium]